MTRFRLPGLLLAASLLSCAPQFVEQRHYAVPETAITRIAVLPFYPHARLSRTTEKSGLAAWEAAAYVTRFTSESLAELGVEVIPENDVQIAFEAAHLVTPRMDPVAAAELAWSKFGAEAVILGTVERYREREGSAYGSFAPASVAFQLTLYDAPTARRLWSGRFDQTQGSVTSDFFTVRHYPGGGSRFLTAAELARWGARQVVAEMPLRR